LLGDNASYGVFAGQAFVHPDLTFTISFPKGWTTAHSKKLAGAQAPDNDAIAVLGAQGKGTSAVEAAERFAKLLEVQYDSGPSELEINEKPAARARLTTSEIDLTLTFIVHEGMVFQLLALSPPSARAKYAAQFDEWAMSFETASAETLASIQEVRLLVAQVGAETTLGSVLERHPSPVPQSFIAVLNGMKSANAGLPGAAIKIPVRVHYSASH
jgi:predicted Zn-dependent protease